MIGGFLWPALLVEAFFVTEFQLLLIAGETCFWFVLLSKIRARLLSTLPGLYFLKLFARN